MRPEVNQVTDDDTTDEKNAFLDRLSGSKLRAAEELLNNDHITTPTAKTMPAKEILNHYQQVSHNLLTPYM